MTIYPRIQEAIDLTWLQGRKSVDENGKCLYRGPDDCKCAIGVIMPDDVVPINPSAAVGRLPLKTLIACGLDPDDIEMMRHAELLQASHDGADDDDFRASFASRVKKFLPGYTIPEEAA